MKLTWSTDSAEYLADRGLAPSIGLGSCGIGIVRRRTSQRISACAGTSSESSGESPGRWTKT
eukprot:scaffold30241_cov28-Tisochrysis_lutea.AAC.6